MTKLRMFVGSLAFASLIHVCSSEAHHSFAMFDQAKTITWHGTVKEFQWNNPHSHIFIEVPVSKDDPSSAGNWDIEAAAPNILVRQGWSRSTLQPGDKVTIVGHPVRGGEKTASLIYALVGDKKLYNNPERPGSAPTPDLPPSK